MFAVGLFGIKNALDLDNTTKTNRNCGVQHNTETPKPFGDDIFDFDGVPPQPHPWYKDYTKLNIFKHF